jgi:hypothetical protein
MYKANDRIRIGNRDAVIAKLAAEGKAKVVYLSDKDEEIVDDALLVDGVWRFASSSVLTGDRARGRAEYEHAVYLSRWGS